MAFQQNFQENATQFEPVGDVSTKSRNRKSVSAPIPTSENSAGFCECNICLDSARDPVVTLCGHLYCWRCIYKWLHVQSSSLEFDKQPKCPVCKAHISTTSLVPLYGRGNSELESKSTHLDPVIPSRPSALGVIQHPNQQPNPYPFQPNHQQSFPQPFGTYASLSSPNFGGTATTSFSSPFIGMFGEMVCAMIFRSFDTSLYAYPYGSYQNLYPTLGNGSPRMRRQVMQVEKSLNRLTIFFFCCFMLCLLLF